MGAMNVTDAAHGFFDVGVQNVDFQLRGSAVLKSKKTSSSQPSCDILELALLIVTIIIAGILRRNTLSKQRATSARVCFAAERKLGKVMSNCRGPFGSNADQ